MTFVLSMIGSAIDEPERRQLRRVMGVALASVLAFCVGMNLTLIRRHPLYMVLGFAVMQSGFVLVYGFWLPRVLRRRLAAEVASNPEAARRHRRQRRWSLFGLVMGGAVGSFAVWWQATRFMG